MQCSGQSPPCKVMATKVGTPVDYNNGDDHGNAALFLSPPLADSRCSYPMKYE